MPVIILLFLTLLSGLALSSPLASADDTVVDEIEITVPISCNLTGVGMNTHTTSLMNGNYATDVGTTTIKAFCNDNEGFAIYAIGYTDDTDGKNVMTSSTLASSYDIPTGLLTSGNNSQWAMKLATQTNPEPTYPISIQNNYNAYHTVPDDYDLVAKRTASTDSGTNAIGSTLTSTYQIYASPTQPAGTYIGKVKYVMVHPHDIEAPLSPKITESGKICYYPNGSNVLGSMGCQTLSNSTTSIDLLASNFSRQGYGFAGWSTSVDYSNSNGFYGPQETITFTAGTYTGSNPGLSLYAHWIPSAGDLQDWTNCNTMSVGAVTALTDKRDNDTYAVAKLADGRCWMIENLRLDNTAAANSTGALAQGYSEQFAGLAEPEAPWSTNNYRDANSLYSKDGSDGTINLGTTDVNYRFPRYSNINTPASITDRPSNPTSNSDTNSISNAGMYSYGNYYTWAAAAANTGIITTNDYNTASICPTGWSIPRGGIKSREATNDFWNLIVAYLNNGTKPANYNSSTTPYFNGSTEGTLVSNKLKAYPNNFVYSGYINNSSVDYRGSRSFYWSSTVQNNSANNLSFYSTRVYPGTASQLNYIGMVVRCVFYSN